MIRLRVSTLETFRRVVQTDYQPESELIETLRRGQWTDGPANWQMNAGTAWHAILANPIRTQQIEFGCDGVPYTVHESGGFRFSGPDVQAALRHVGPGLHEVPAGRTWDIDGRQVRVTGTADHVRGLVVQDHKTKFSTPDARDYEASLQWRFYLLLQEAVVFRFNLFDFRDPDDTGLCELKEIVSFRFWPYVGMEADCRFWLREFLAWADDRGLLGLLEGEKKAA